MFLSCSSRIPLQPARYVPGYQRTFIDKAGVDLDEYRPSVQHAQRIVGTEDAATADNWKPIAALSV
jgi:hypothetical protein